MTVAPVYHIISQCSDTDSSSTLLFNSTNARVPVDSSDNYTVTIFASNGCPGLAEEIGK